MPQQRRIEPLPAIIGKSCAMPDVGFSSLKVNAQADLANLFFIKCHPAIRYQLARDAPDVPMPASLKALRHNRWISEIHSQRQFSRLPWSGSRKDHRRLE